MEELIKLKIQCVGDVHGFTNFMSVAHQEADKNKADVLFNVGDFGYWVHTKSGQKFMNLSSKDSNTWDRDFYFLPGNHENWDLLDQFECSYHDTPWGKIWCAEVAHRVFYVPPAAQWEWDGKKFLAIGGAYSIDKESRLYREDLGRSGMVGEAYAKQYWPQEMITDDEEALAIEAGKIDVLLTHDNSDYVDITDCIGKDVRFETRVNRARISRIIDVTRPTINVHGHYHYPYETDIIRPFDNDGHMDWFKTHVVGLDCNFNPNKALYLLDTDNLE